jgi:hypothetical protein
MLISIVNLSHGALTDEELQRVIRAINRQIAQDFLPYWSFGATLRPGRTPRGSGAASDANATRRREKTGSGGESRRFWTNKYEVPERAEMKSVDLR